MKSKGRKVCICKRCGKESLHFGLGMCSSCLRKTKRETKPSFYLGTCYSEIKRRCSHKDILRPNYFGKNFCTREEFFNKFLTDDNFLLLFDNWRNHNFKRGEAPSIDRIDNNGDYSIENSQFIKHSENTGKDSKGSESGENGIYRGKKVIDENGYIYSSLVECAKRNDVSKDNLRKYIELGRELNGKRYKLL